MREEVMAERSKQKLKLIYLMQILMEKTDETHSITCLLYTSRCV